VHAISREAKSPGEAIEFFNRSKEGLETELRNYYTNGKKSSSLDEISAKHSFLALVHWLYPNYIGYNRTRNAIKMFQHAAAAQGMSLSKRDFSYCVGLMVQLRITPFLVKSKKKTVGDLATLRSTANEFLSSTDTYSRSYLSSMVSDGLGFSYFLFERDIDSALKFLTRAADYFAEYETNFAASDSESLKTQFLRSFASTLYWDLGICYEGKVEATEGEEMLEDLKKARSYYEKSRDYALRSPWHIYRAMSTYNLSGTYYREGMAEFEREKALPLLERSVNLGEESLNWFRLWSSFEGDFLGGSWIATFYQHLAIYSDDPSIKEKSMHRSLELAEKADALINNKKVGLSRYKAVNIGDIFFRNSEYNRQTAVELRFENESSVDEGSSNEEKVVDLLERSLADCIKSRTFFRDPAFGSRKISSALLAGDICFDLQSSPILSEEQRDTNSSRAKRYFHEATKISKNLQLSETIATSSWRLAQVFDREGRFAQSATEFEKARDAFETIGRSSSNFRLYEESSRYMHAWRDIEKAKSAHTCSKFDEASTLYREASDLIGSTRRWKPRSHLYSAESLIEEAEKLSLVENSEAIGLFSNAKQTLTMLERELSGEDSIEAKSFTRLGRHLSSFCDARILLEKSKEYFRSGNIEQSVSGLSEAETVFSNLSRDFSSAGQLEANELMSLASLCSALTYFQRAQIEGDAALIQKAESIFSEASEQSKSASLKPLLKGLSSFAAFLYSSKIVEQSLDSSIDVERLTECGRAIDSAERILSKLGNKSFLSMLRASKHILEASIKISAAEREVVDHEAKAKLYSQAQRSLSLASRYYSELGSSEKMKESLRLLSTVKQSRELIPLANEMFAEVASNQMIYSAVSSTSILGASPEDSARQIDSSFLVLDVSIPYPLVSPDEEVSVSMVLSNFGKEQAHVVGIQEAIPEEFEPGSKPEDNRKFKGRSLILNLKLQPGASETITLSARPGGVGEFNWHPAVLFQDPQGNQKLTRAETAKVVVEVEDLVAIVDSLRSKKEKIEQELNEKTSSEDGAILLREELSKVEEELHRLRNEYDNLSAQLEQINQDLLALNTVQDESLKHEEKRKLETEREILLERIERRRLLFQ